MNDLESEREKLIKSYCQSSISTLQSVMFSLEFPDLLNEVNTSIIQDRLSDVIKSLDTINDLKKDRNN